jgi:hypothetical protein
MKKALMLVIVMFSAIYSADAQWYYKSCGVTDLNNITSEDFQCLNKMATKKVTAGAISMVVGTTAIIGGSLLFQNANMDTNSDMGEVIIGAGSIFGGVYLIGAGIIIDLVGTALLLSGVNRHITLRKTPYYQNRSPSVLNISPTINRDQFNNTYSLGLTASLRF